MKNFMRTSLVHVTQRQTAASMQIGMSSVPSYQVLGLPGRKLAPKRI